MTLSAMWFLSGDRDVAPQMGRLVPMGLDEALAAHVAAMQGLVAESSGPVLGGSGIV